MLTEKFTKLASPKSPFVQVPSTRDRLHWLKPKLVAEIKFKEWTRAGIVRAPVFMGLRDDVDPQDCRMKDTSG
jgi:bifunctional non-homologous end joining protein LigD